MDGQLQHPLKSVEKLAKGQVKKWSVRGEYYSNDNSLE